MEMEMAAEAEGVSGSVPETLLGAPLPPHAAVVLLGLPIRRSGSRTLPLLARHSGPTSCPGPEAPEMALHGQDSLLVLSQLA